MFKEAKKLKRGRESSGDLLIFGKNKFLIAQISVFIRHLRNSKLPEAA